MKLLKQAEQCFVLTYSVEFLTLCLGKYNKNIVCIIYNIVFLCLPYKLEFQSDLCVFIIYCVGNSRKF